MFNLRILYLVFTLYTITAILSASPFHPSIEVNTLSERQTEITFRLPEIKIIGISEQSRIFQQIEIEGALAGSDTALPDLPHFSTTIAVPINSKISTSKIEMSEARYIKDLHIYPVQNHQNTERIFDYDTEFYHSKDTSLSYPTQSYFITDIQTMRDIDFITVKLYPIRYFPATHTIEIVDYIHLTLEHLSRETSPIYYHKPKLSRPFERMYENLISNYSQIRTPNPAYQEPSILILYGGSGHTNYFNTNLNYIITIKKQKGFQVEAVSTNIIGNTTTSIKSLIQNRYLTSINPPEWVVLIGGVFDGNYIIPYYTDSGDGDYEYTRLSSNNDVIGDVFIGRISIASDNDLANYYQKLLKYEINTTDTIVANNSWLNRSLLISDPSESGISCVIINRYIKSLISDYDPAHNVTELYQYAPSAFTILEMVNTGQLFFNFRGIQFMNQFVYQIPNLTNSNKLPNCIFITCGTGHYNNTPRYTENITRHTYQNQPAGALTAIGMSEIHTHTAFNNALDGGIAYSMYVADASTMGEALLFGKTYLYTAYPDSYSESFTQMTMRWANLMGDPSAHIFKTKPKTFSTRTPDTVPFGTQAIRFVVADHEELPVPDAFVTISNSTTSFLQKAISDEDGVAIVALDPELPGPFIVCISKPGFQTIRNVLMVSQFNPAVSVTDFITYDPAPNGNNNHHLNPGEIVNLSIQVKNYTDTDLIDLTAEIDSDSRYFLVPEMPPTALGSISAGQERLFDDAFTFTISPEAPDKILLPITITISDGSSSWVSYLLPEVRGVDITIVNMYALNQNHVSIGGQTDVYFSLKNMGTTLAPSLYAELISRSDFCTVLTEPVYLGSMGMYATTDNRSQPFSIAVAPSGIAGMKIPISLRLYNSNGYETLLPYTIGETLSVGVKTVSDPTGPDEYGYVILDSHDSIYHPLKAYNWIDISSLGANTGLVDLSPLQEEAMVVKSLPFTVKYYGVEYDRISICSNGFFVFGETQQRDFRNLPIPGPIVPKAIVAPYWTDLVVGGDVQSMVTGNVYTYHHPTQHTYIIQWQAVRLITGYFYASIFDVSPYTVSFQVIIYDTQYYPTSSGDNQIKIQYQNFHQGVAGIDTGPINFITVGMQDHTAKRGIQYVYNNIYSPGSRPLSNNSALLFTYFDEYLPCGDTVATPQTFSVRPSYPNPFNPTTNIGFYLPTDSPVQVDVYNVKGQLVKSLLKDTLAKGEHIVQWNGDNAHGQSVGSGVYFFRVSDGVQNQVRKAVLLK